jgi:hypothetical protein
MNETNTYKEPTIYKYYLNPQHIVWAKEIRWKFPKLLFHFTDEEVAIMYEHWSEGTHAAGWLLEDTLTEKHILNILSRYKVDNGKVYYLLNEPKPTTVSQTKGVDTKGDSKQTGADTRGKDV